MVRRGVGEPQNAAKSRARQLPANDVPQRPREMCKMSAATFPRFLLIFLCSACVARLPVPHDTARVYLYPSTVITTFYPGTV